MKWTTLKFNKLLFIGNVQTEPGGPPVWDVVEIKREITHLLRDCTQLSKSNMLVFYEFFYVKNIDIKVSTSICASTLVSLAMRVTVEGSIPSRTECSLMFQETRVIYLKFLDNDIINFWAHVKLDDIIYKYCKIWGVKKHNWMETLGLRMNLKELVGLKFRENYCGDKR